MNTPEEQIAHWREHALWLEGKLSTATMSLATCEERSSRLRDAWRYLAFWNPGDARDAAAAHLLSGDLGDPSHDGEDGGYDADTDETNAHGHPVRQTR